MSMILSNILQILSTNSCGTIKVGIHGQGSELYTLKSTQIYVYDKNII